MRDHGRRAVDSGEHHILFAQQSQLFPGSATDIYDIFCPVVFEHGTDSVTNRAQAPGEQKIIYRCRVFIFVFAQHCIVIPY